MFEHLRFTNPSKLFDALNACGFDRFGHLDSADFEIEQFETSTFSTCAVTSNHKLTIL